MKFTELFDKKYLTRVVALVLGVAAVVGILFYVGFHFFDSFSTELDLVDARLTSHTELIYAQAYLMRSERQLTSETAVGSIVPEVHDGTHVASGALIAEVYSKSAPEVEERLDEIDEQIALFEKSRDEDRSVQSTAGIDTEIYSTVNSIRESAEKGNSGDAISLRTGLLVNIKKRAILSGEITDYEAQIAMLEKEKASLTSSLGTRLESIYAGNAGYYYASCDGYGSVFDPSLIDSMTYDDFLAMTNAEAEDTTHTVGIMVSDYVWYIACELAKQDAGRLAELGECRVNFLYSGTTLDMTVERVIPQTPGDRAVIVLRCGTLETGFDYTRVQPVELCAETYTGFELPKSALRIQNGSQGVYIMDEVTIRFRRINVIYEDDDIVICTGDPKVDISVVKEGEEANDTAESEDEWIRQNDVVVVSGTELYSGKVIKQ